MPPAAARPACGSKREGSSLVCLHSSIDRQDCGEVGSVQAIFLTVGKSGSDDAGFDGRYHSEQNAISLTSLLQCTLRLQEALTEGVLHATSMLFLLCPWQLVSVASCIQILLFSGEGTTIVHTIGRGNPVVRDEDEWPHYGALGLVMPQSRVLCVWERVPIDQMAMAVLIYRSIGFSIRNSSSCAVALPS
jgi:hypothetical protein